MKKMKYFSLLLAAGMFAACSDNLDDAGKAGGTAPDATEGYVRVAINMPTTKGNVTRADDDQDSNPDIDFVDGVKNEYKVTDGVIVFFKTTDSNQNSDTEATFVSAYSLPNMTFQEDASAQVTEKVVTVSKAPAVATGEQLFALVILNVPTTVVVDANTHGLTLDATALTSTSTLKDFTKALAEQTLTDYTGSSNDDFTMCNAPLSTQPGTNITGAEAKTLVPVTVYKTENEALSNDAARIYVERVVAKVTLTGFEYADSKYTKSVTNTTGVYNGDVVQLDGWILNVTNRFTKLVRDVSGYNATGWLANATGTAINNTPRFAGVEVIPVDYSGTNYYRIYWAEDGNYTSATESDFTTYYTNETNGSITPSKPDWNPDTSDNNVDGDDDHALYCFENTMNYDQQKEGQTTAVLLQTTYKAKFGTQDAAAQDFFICGANPVKYPRAADIPAEGGGTVEDIVSFVIKTANNVLTNKIQTDQLELNEVPAGIYDSKEDLKKLFTLTSTSDTEEKWNAIWNQVGTIRYYKEGISYYYASRIRHFYDDETPWKDGESYGIQHLGRYGVVRNNWYEVNIKTISGPGEPSIVKPDDNTPDDKAEGYIRAEINVLSWAKRSQGVDL